MRVLLVALLVLSSILAGCTDATDPPADVPDDGAPDAPRTQPGGGGADADLPMAEAPQWQPGDWWRWNVEPRDAPAYEATTAVASAEADSFLIGWDSVDEGLLSQFFHFIPNGVIARPALSYEAHHEPVEWFEFPLHDGKQWNGSFWRGDLAFSAAAAQVTGPQGPVEGFRITGESPDDRARIEYDWATDLQVFTVLRVFLFGDVPWLSLTLLEQGSGRTEPIHILHSEMSIDRFSSIQATTGSDTPRPPAEGVEIPEGVTHVSIGCYLGGPPGYYEYRLTDSAGVSHVCEAEVAADWFGMDLAYGPVSAGDAVSAFTTAGQGSVFAEVFFVTAEERVPG